MYNDMWLSHFADIFGDTALAFCKYDIYQFTSVCMYCTFTVQQYLCTGEDKFV